MQLAAGYLATQSRKPEGGFQSRRVKIQIKEKVDVRRASRKEITESNKRVLMLSGTMQCSSPAIEGFLVSSESYTFVVSKLGRAFFKKNLIKHFLVCYQI